MQSVKKILSKIVRFITVTLLALFCICLIIGGISELTGPPITPKDIKVVSVVGTLAANPEVNDQGKHRNARLLLNEYPNRSFNIFGDAFYATKSGIINDYVSAGDTVFMEVSAEDYQNNMIGVQAPDHMLPVDVYSLNSKGQDFLTLADYCKEANSNGWVSVVGILVGGLFLFAIFWGLWKKMKLRNEGK